jgi:hypothetical protein
VTAGSWIALAIVVLLVGTLAWPWAQVQPLKRPFEALQRLSAFDWDRTVLFDGADVRATALPFDYVPRWAAVTTPPVVLVGAAASLLLLLRRPRTGRWRVLGLWAAALFPAAYVVVSRATIYDGIRHLLFAYPPLVALAACGWDGLLHGEARGRRLAAGCVLAAGLLEPAWFCWRNHPNECVYFNALAGGPRGALGRYELDYWGNSVRQAVAWIAAVRPDGGHVVVSGHPPQVVRDEARRLPGLQFARAELQRHQLDVLVLRGKRSEVLELAARTDVLHRVTTADGATLAVVVPGPAFTEIASWPAFASPSAARSR